MGNQPTPLPREAILPALKKVRALRVDLLRGLAATVPAALATQETQSIAGLEVLRIGTRYTPLSIPSHPIPPPLFPDSPGRALPSSHLQTIHSLLCLVIYTLTHGAHAHPDPSPLHSCIRQIIDHLYAEWWSLAPPGEVRPSAQRNVLMRCVRTPIFASGMVPPKTPCSACSGGLRLIVACLFRDRGMAMGPTDRGGGVESLGSSGG